MGKVIQHLNLTSDILIWYENNPRISMDLEYEEN